MAADDALGQSEGSQAPSRPPITPAKRKNLQKIFAHGSKMMAQQNHDYATELFGQCVIGDPANLIYVQNYIGNLQRKYNHNKTGSKLAQFKERGARSAVKKAVAHGTWDEAIRNGLKVLAVNPWDVPALTAMAMASENSGDEEVELFYLKCALDANPKDAEVNRQCARALASRRQYDQAIACWNRVKNARPDDDEADREMGRLAVEKTIDRGGYESESKGKKTVKEEPQKPLPRKRELSREEVLRRKIEREPEDIANYRELAQVHFDNESYEAAQEVLAAALEASDNDPDIREEWEDAQLRHLRQRITRAEDDETRNRLRREMLEKELERYQNRCRRYPGNLSFKYELGYRCQLVGDYNQAIKQLQVARNDPRRRPLCMYRLGQCFQQIGQHRLAMSHYESAIEEMSDREAQAKRDVLYRAGGMALHMNDLDRAEKYLTQLAGLDFNYRDVSKLLDKVTELRENQGD